MRRFKFLVICIVLLFGLLDVCRAGYCGFPGTSPNSRVEFSRETLTSGTFAVYSCDDGYRLLGSRSRYCLDEGKWSASLPVCVVNVALNKPVNSSSGSVGGVAEHGNDGNIDNHHRKQFCVETNKESNPWWKIDLIQTYDVYGVNIYGNADLDNNGQVSNLQVRVGNSSILSDNQLCAWLPDILDPSAAKEILCAVPLRGRYVSLHVGNSEPTILSFCEIQVFSNQEPPVIKCPVRSAQTHVFQRRCYDFHLDVRSSVGKASKNCNDNAGSLVTRANSQAQQFLASTLKRMELSKILIPPANVWIGLSRGPGGQPWTWIWPNNVTANATSWADGQPNEFDTKASVCVAMSSNLDYNWQDVLCNTDANWICQFETTGCGSPEIKSNSTITNRKSSYKTGETIEYFCDSSSQLVGSPNRTCLQDGTWTPEAPVCRYVDCGEPPKIRDSVQFLLQQRTTFGSEVEYACVGNLSLIGSSRGRCGPNGWTGNPTECRYVNCGYLPAIANGAALLLDGGTFYKARARYECADNYTLIGSTLLSCNDDSTWNTTIPVCKLKECLIPATFYNGKIVGTNYSLGMSIGYVCDEGYYLSSDYPNSRTCLMDQKWSSDPPTCIPIDCGMPEALANGTFSLLNDGTTYNKSVVYGCEKNFALEGDQQRFCTIAGLWSSTSPKCIVSECNAPDLDENQLLAIKSFPVGSVAIFSCKSGYRVQGPQSYTCHPDGYWTGQKPFCHFLDCGAPPVVKHGTHRSSSASGTLKNGLGTVITYTCDSNTTLLGDSVIYCTETEIWSGYPPTCVGCGAPEVVEKGVIVGNDYSLNKTIQYSCEPGYRLEGVIKRSCQYPGEWTEQSPLCHEILCQLPPAPINGSLSTKKAVKVGSQLHFNCNSGNARIGAKSSTCNLDGTWDNEPPICQYVYCGKPPEVKEAKTSYNGTAYGSIAKYACKDGLFIDGEADIFCIETGKWQTPPSCSLTPVEEKHFDGKLLDDDANVIPRRAAENLSSSNSGTSQLGMGIGIAIACLLVLLTFVGSVIWIKVRGRKAHSADLPIGRATYVDPNFSFKPAKSSSSNGNGVHSVQVTKAYVNDAFDSTAL